MKKATTSFINILLPGIFLGIMIGYAIALTQGTILLKSNVKGEIALSRAVLKATETNNMDSVRTVISDRLQKAYIGQTTEAPFLLKKLYQDAVIKKQIEAIATRYHFILKNPKNNSIMPSNTDL